MAWTGALLVVMARDPFGAVGVAAAATGHGVGASVVRLAPRVGACAAAGRLPHPDAVIQLLGLLAQGVPAAEAVEDVAASWQEEGWAALAAVGTWGEPAAWVADPCPSWSGVHKGQGSLALGVRLPDESPVARALDAWERQASRPFPQRLWASLKAGGLAHPLPWHSAVLQAVGPGGEGGETTSPLPCVDVRVDASSRPVQDLSRALRARLGEVPWEMPKPLSLTPKRREQLSRWLEAVLGYPVAPQAEEVCRALAQWAESHDLAARLLPGSKVDPVLWDKVRRLARRRTLRHGDGAARAGGGGTMAS